jgi:hypothetical protein
LEDSCFEKDVILTSLHSSASLDFDGSTFLSDMRVNGAVIAGSLSVSGEARAARGLNLDTLTTNYLSLKGTKQARSGFFLAPVFASLWLASAKIAGALDMSDATVNGPVNMANIQVGAELRMRKVHLSKEVDLTNSRIGSYLALEGPTDSRTTVNLTAAHIGGTLILGSRDYGPIRWRYEARLILRDATVNDLQDGIGRGATTGSWNGAWPGSIELDGFTYQHLGSTEQAGISSRPADWLIGWLDHQEQFSAQPYGQLARILRDIGNDAIARQVLISMEERRRRDDTSIVWWAWGRILKITIGYGYAPFRSLGFIVFFVTLGTILFSWGHSAGVISQTGEHSKSHYKPFNSFVYSLETFLPLVELHQGKHWLPDANLRPTAPVLLFGTLFRYQHSFNPRLARRLRCYLWAHILLGWFFSLMLLAGISGLVHGG